MPSNAGVVVMPARYFFVSARSVSTMVCAIFGSDTKEGQNSMGVCTARSRTTDPLEARARRAATGMARSARGEPSRGTRIRLNMVLLLFSTVLSLSTPVVCFFLRGAYPCPLTTTSQEGERISQKYHKAVDCFSIILLLTLRIAQQAHNRYRPW